MTLPKSREFLNGVGLRCILESSSVFFQAAYRRYGGRVALRSQGMPCRQGNSISADAEKSTACVGLTEQVVDRVLSGSLRAQSGRQKHTPLKSSGVHSML